MTDERTHIRVRQLASSVTHLADPSGLTQYGTTLFGESVTAAHPPVATLCRATLRRRVLVIPTRPERGYQVTCEACLAVAEA